VIVTIVTNVTISILIPFALLFHGLLLRPIHISSIIMLFSCNHNIYISNSAHFIATTMIVDGCCCKMTVALAQLKANSCTIHAIHAIHAIPDFGT
jgi:hypothetical protein